MSEILSVGGDVLGDGGGGHAQGAGGGWEAVAQEGDVGDRDKKRKGGWARERASGWRREGPGGAVETVVVRGVTFMHTASTYMRR